MRADASDFEAVVPTKAEAQVAQESGRILAAHGHGDLRVQLDDGQTLVLPRSVSRLLQHMLAAMADGNAVTLIPIHAEMTTQEAADHLNVSRPHLIKVLEREEIPFRKVGTHRRILFEDVQRYKAKIEADRSHTLDELARQSQELGMGY